MLCCWLLIVIVEMLVSLLVASIVLSSVVY